MIRPVLVLATYALLWYGTRLFMDWELRSRAEFSFRLSGWWVSLTVFLLAGVVLAVAARFPFPHPRFAWGRIVIALLILLPPIHLSLFQAGWIHPSWLFQPWWFDTVSIGQVSAVLAGVAIGCGFGARREPSASA